MRLKKILENMDKMPNTLGKMTKFNENPKLSPDQKRKLMEMVGQYNELGQKLKMENALIETATALSEISQLAETYACNEASDWFATEVVKTDFKRARGISETFQKLARECHGKVQQLNALYEDMGHILGRYYEISDPVQEVCPNPADMKSQKGLPNAQPQTIMQEVKPNDKNLQSQRQLPSNGQIKEVSVNDKNIKSQRTLPAGGPAPAQVKEVAVDDKHANIKGQRNLPAGGPTPYNPPKDPKDTGSVKESSGKFENCPTCGKAKEKGVPCLKCKESDKEKTEKSKNSYWNPKDTDENIVNEVDHDESNLQSQRELPSGGPESYSPPKQENPSIPVNPAGSGEMNVKGERNVPQGGPSKDNVYESTKLSSIIKNLNKYI